MDGEICKTNIMKKISYILLSIFIILEILAIILYIKKEISSKTFFLLVMSFSMMIGLYIINKRKINNQ